MYPELEKKIRLIHLNLLNYEDEYRFILKYACVFYIVIVISNDKLKFISIKLLCSFPCVSRDDTT